MFEAHLNCMFQKTALFLIFQSKKIAAIDLLDEEISPILWPPTSLLPLSGQNAVCIFFILIWEI